MPQKTKGLSKLRGGGEEEDAAAALMTIREGGYPASALMGVYQDLSARDALLGLRSIKRNQVARPSTVRERNTERMRMVRAVERAASTPEEIEAQLAKKREYQRELTQRRNRGELPPSARQKRVKRGGNMASLHAFINGTALMTPQLANEIAMFLQQHGYSVSPIFYPTVLEEERLREILAHIMSVIHQEGFHGDFIYTEPRGDGKKLKFAKKYLKGMGVRATEKNVSELMSAMDAEGVVF
jgi:hypothetical protein